MEHQRFVPLPRCDVTTWSRRALLGVLAGGMATTHLRPVGAIAQEDSISDLVAGNTRFALDLYAALRQDAEGNLLVSPYSISQALAMTYAGALGETATQMAETLAFELPQPALHETFAALTADFVARGNAAADPETAEPVGGLRIANALWGEQTFPFSPAYSEQIEQFYGAALQDVDFRTAPEEARVQINDWVAAQTEERIQDIVPPRAITTETRLVLANAIWFAGRWASPFDPDATEDDHFFLLDGTAETVPFMVQQSSLPYARGDGYQAIEFSYADRAFAFTVIVPDDGRFEDVERGFDATWPTVVIGQVAAAETDVRVYLPSFAFEFATSLRQTLSAMGMTDAFDSARADFTGMVDGTLPEPLFIGVVLHKAFIRVDEHGTEAAAATVVHADEGVSEPEDEPIDVRINRPFLFAIRDTETGTILFLGRVLHPQA